MRARIESLLGGGVETFARRDLTVRGAVGEHEGYTELRLQTVDGGVPGERTLRGANCEEVVSAGALVVALAVDSNAVAARQRAGGVASFASSENSTTGPAPSPPSSAAPRAADAPLPPVAPVAGPARQERLDPPRTTTGDVVALGVVDVGTMPGLAPGTGIRAGFGSGRFALGVDVAYFFERFAKARSEPEGSGKGANVSLLRGALRGCHVTPLGRFELGPCAGVEAGALLAQGAEFRQTSAQVEPWLALLGLGEIRYVGAAPLSLRAALGFAAPLGRPHIRYRRKSDGNLEEIHRPTFIAGRAEIGVGLVFE